MRLLQKGRYKTFSDIDGGRQESGVRKSAFTPKIYREKRRGRGIFRGTKAEERGKKLKF